MTQYVWIQSLHILLHSLYWIKEDMGAFEPKRNPNLNATSLREVTIVWIYELTPIQPTTIDLHFHCRLVSLKDAPIRIQKLTQGTVLKPYQIQDANFECLGSYHQKIMKLQLRDVRFRNYVFTIALLPSVSVLHIEWQCAAK